MVLRGSRVSFVLGVRIYLFSSLWYGSFFRVLGFRKFRVFESGLCFDRLRYVFWFRRFCW